MNFKIDHYDGKTGLLQSSKLWVGGSIPSGQAKPLFQVRSGGQLCPQENPRFLGVPMKIFKFIGLVLWIQAVQVSASDSFVRIQASPNESIVHSSSGATTEQKSNSIVISTPTPRERVVSPSAQSIAPMPIIIQPNMPPAKKNKTSKAVDQKNSIKE